MTTFDQLFFTVFTAFKARFKQKANSIALAYISSLQIALFFLLGVFTATFLTKMNASTISSQKAWTLFVLIAIAIHIKNWLKYSGKSRKVLNAKFNRSKASSHNLTLLLSLPLVSLILAIILLQSM
ncbi:hypothetical protein [Olleya sp. UBA1516]|uniref:hypothetical protein n=1 Tax=Olleya sp. UBA1516 TaxID=1947013 RepID=UPI0025D5B431|nr:hypothetical protein [Olleya sp. UBA1516]|tara:strand:+ start:144681 stop:145058 length:378 start_codon:yes stop_codon:yes gene_type:complete